MPVIFFDADTRENFCIKLYALVWPREDLPVGMVIGQTGLTFLTTNWKSGAVTYDMKFDNGERAKVKYVL